MDKQLASILTTLMVAVGTAANANGSTTGPDMATGNAKTAVTDSLFCHGRSVLQGRFTGKHPEIMEYYGQNGVTGESKPKTYDVAADGSFCISFDLDYPIFDYVVHGDNILYFYACPGDTANVTIDSTGMAHYQGTTRHKRLLELMSNEGIRPKINHKAKLAMAQKSTFAEFTAWAETQIDSLKGMVDSISGSHGLTAEERKLLNAYTMIDACTDCFDYRYINGFAIDTNTDDYHS